MQITIFGDSHVGTLAAGKSIFGNEYSLTLFGCDGRNWIDPEIQVSDKNIKLYSDVVREAKPLDLELYPKGIFYFSSPLHTAPYIRSKVWKKFCPWGCYESNRELMPVPDSVIHAWVDEVLDGRMAFLKILIENGFDVTVVEPPRLLERAPKIHDIKAGVALQVDVTCRRYISLMLEKLGVDIIEVPSETVINGFTPEDYSSLNPLDSHHGGKNFGMAMMEKIFNHARLKS